MKHLILLSLLSLILISACVTTPLADMEFATPVIAIQHPDCTYFSISVVNNGPVKARNVVASMMISLNGMIFRGFKLDFGDIYPGVVETMSHRVMGLNFGDDIKITGMITFD